MFKETRERRRPNLHRNENTLDGGLFWVCDKFMGTNQGYICLSLSGPPIQSGNDALREIFTHKFVADPAFFVYCTNHIKSIRIPMGGSE